MTAEAQLPIEDLVQSLADDQAGVISRQQLRDRGISRVHVRTQLRARRWQRVHPRTYAIFTGPLPFLTRVWAALLYAGPGAVASHRTAAYLQRLVDQEPEILEILIPHGRRVRARPLLKIRQCRRLARVVHPARLPKQTRLEETVLDLTDLATVPETVIDLVLRACQRRLTTAKRLSLAARGRRRLRWRALLRDIVAEVRHGIQSALERRWLRDVERPHGLPRGYRNRGEGERGRRRSRDVRYRRWRVIVELDGRAAHPEEWREQDDLRDNEVLVAEGTATFRYGWRTVTCKPCAAARQVADALSSRGWTGKLRRCGPNCTAFD